MNSIRLLFIGIVSWILASCAGTQAVTNLNLAELYRETEREIKPKCTVYHVEDNKSLLYVRLESSNLLYVKSEGGDNFKAKAKVTYILYKPASANMVSDSASFIIEDINNDMLRKELVGKVFIDATYPNKYLMRVQVKDLNKGNSESIFTLVDKTTRSGRQNYLVSDGDEGYVEFDREFGSDRKLKVKYNNEMIKRVAVKYYDRDFQLTPPPFAIYTPKRFDFTPDSMYYVNLDEENAFELLLNKKGLFHIQTDSASKEGLTLIRNYDDFPDVAYADQMVHPLRFITTNREYQEIKASENPRDGVEEYWLTVANSPDRARELIRNYYGRVEDANAYFTTHLPGWKTDRGLIYIIFGPPDVIYKSGQGESWIYGNGTTQPSITYNFNLTYNPFSGNDLRLELNPEYKTYWYKAVDTWLQGRVYKY
jgi:GWxTD domain-containing protein